MIGKRSRREDDFYKDKPRKPRLLSCRNVGFALAAYGVIWMAYLILSTPSAMDATDAVYGNRILWTRGWEVAADVPVPGSSYYQLDTVVAATPSEMLASHLSAIKDLQGTTRGPLVVWVRSIDLVFFGEQLMPSIDALPGDLSIILVNTDGYYTVPDDLRATKAATAILRSRRVERWYVQNLMRSSLRACCEDLGMASKLVMVPMGMDFHTNTVNKYLRIAWRLWIKFGPGRYHWSSSSSADRGRHMRLLAEARDRARPRSSRARAIWSDAHLKSYPRFGDPRGELAKVLEKHKHEAHRLDVAVDFATGRVPQEELWDNYGSYRFVVGALGMGMDCHRTWEVLHLGAVLVTVHSPLDELYESIGAPVVILNSWEQMFNSTFMELQWDRVQGIPDYTPVYNPLPPLSVRTMDDARQPLFVNAHAGSA